MKHKLVWSVPMFAGALLFLIYGALGVLFWYMAQSSMITWKMSAMYPVVLLTGVGLAYFSYRKLFEKDKVLSPAEIAGYGVCTTCGGTLRLKYPPCHLYNEFICEDCGDN